VSEQWKTSSENDDVQMPLGTGDAGGDAGYSEEPKAKMNTSTLALIASFMAAVAVIYLLGLHNKPRQASAEQAAHEQKVSSAITELLQKNGKAEQIQNLFKDTDKLVQMFYSYLGSKATQSAELPGNPFASESVTPVPGTSQAAVFVASNAGEAENLRRIAETFNTLKLQSVMVGGKNTVAMINNRMLQVGGTIGDLTVTTIEPSRVVLSYGSNHFELKLSRDKP
jgi:hypothetical protein